MRIFAGKGAVTAAIGLGLLTSFLVWRYMDQAQPSAAAMQTTPVVVAAVPIEPRTVVTAQMLRVQQMPVEAVHPQSMQTIDQVVDKVARVSITSDEPILTSKLYLQRGESGLAFMVPAGMRAVSVAFNETIGSGGMVSPGDHVDIVGVFDAPKTEVEQANQALTSGNATPPDKNKRPAQNSTIDPTTTGQDDKISTATLVLQDVEVLAVAQQLEGEAPPSNNMVIPGTTPPNPAAAPNVKSQPAPMPAAKTATLAVTPDDALKLVLAEERGKIRLALRRNKDTGRPVIGDVPQSALLMSAH